METTENQTAGKTAITGKDPIIQVSIANRIGLDGKSGYDIARENGFEGTATEYGNYPITQGDYARNAAENITASFEELRQVINTSVGSANTAAENARQKAVLAEGMANYAQQQGDNLSSKSTRYLFVTVTGTSSSPLYTFIKQDFDAVALAVQNGAPVFVNLTDSRTAANKPLNLSGIYPSVWNKSLSQIEVQSPNIARGFYLNGNTPANRGCVTTNTGKYVARGASFDPISGNYTLNELTFNEDRIAVIFSSTSNRWGAVPSLWQNYPYETLFPLDNSNFSGTGFHAVSLFAYSNIIKLKISTAQTVVFAPSSATPGIFENCTQLEEIQNVIGCHNASAFVNTFRGTPKLTKIKLSGLKVNIAFPDSPLINKESIVFLLTNAINPVGTQITVTLHPTVYNWASVDHEIQALLPASAIRGQIILASA